MLEFRTVASALAMTVVVTSTAAYAAETTQAPDIGPNPTLAAPDTSLIPTVNVAPVNRWPDGTQPNAALDGSTVTEFAKDLQHPRNVYRLPNGDILVVQSDAPAKEASIGIKSLFMKYFMKKAGSQTPSANRITLLRDANGDGKTELRSEFLQGLNSPFGVALVGSTLYVANADSVVSFPYADGATSITDKATKVADLPAGINHHWTKNLVASKDGSKLYVAVGSNSNIAENGMDAEKDRAAILEIDPKSGTSRVFASGLRNPVGMAFEPTTGELWTVVNERDELGDTIVPDYLTHVKDGAFYGWPYSYYGANVDTRVAPQMPDLVAKAVKPDYALGAHTASLGLAFADQPSALTGKAGAFIAQHGSWNRSEFAGYKVMFVPFANGKPDGMPQDVLTGFLNKDREAMGRPVSVAFDKTGALLVADDVGNRVWRVTAAPVSN